MKFRSCLKVEKETSASSFPKMDGGNRSRQFGRYPTTTMIRGDATVRSSCIATISQELIRKALSSVDILVCMCVAC